jgi:3,4-dihydroxy 2-butanone 4-phosphate synthase/GTP cyclohydrolase II
MTLEGTPEERVRRAIDAIRAGRMVILTDDEDRENEGDLVLAAEKVTPEAINFMAKYARGLICLTLTEETIDRLRLPMMVEKNNASLGTAFTVSIEAREGVTTGISAADRAHTVRVAVAPDAARGPRLAGAHLPAAREARRRAPAHGADRGLGRPRAPRGLTPSGVICEIMNDDGTMARMPDLVRFSPSTTSARHHRRPHPLPPQAPTASCAA